MYLAYEQRVLRHIFFSLSLEFMLNSQLVILDTLLVKTDLKTDWYNTEYISIEQHPVKLSNQMYFGMLKFTIPVICILVALITSSCNNTDSQMKFFTYDEGLGPLRSIFLIYLYVLVGICHTVVPLSYMPPLVRHPLDYGSFSTHGYAITHVIYENWRKPVSSIFDMILELAQKAYSLAWVITLISCKLYLLTIDPIYERSEHWVKCTKRLTMLIPLAFYLKYVSVKQIYRLLTTDYHKQSHKMQMFTLMLKSDVDRKEREVKISRDSVVDMNEGAETILLDVAVNIIKHFLILIIFNMLM